MIRSSFPGCTCTFKDRCKLREHLRSHTQEKVVACPTCGGMFANNTKFLDHIRRQTSLDRKKLERRGRVWAILLEVRMWVFSQGRWLC